MRVKWDRELRARYAAICIHRDLPDPYRLLRESFLRLYGGVTVGLSGLKLIERRGNILVVRVWHRYLPALRAAVAMMRMDGEPIQAHVFLVSGTLKSLRDKLKGRSSWPASRATGP